MLTKTKNVLIGLLLASALSGCAAQTSSGGMSAMKMDSGMCKKMMGEKKCCCCQQMQCMDSMRTSGMMTGGIPFQSRKSWRGAVVIQPASAESKDTIDLPPHELRDLIRGIIWRDEHFNGMTIRDLAAREGHSEVFVGRLIHRTFETA